MTGAFYGAASFNQNLSLWPVEEVTSMQAMFRNAVSFNAPISLNTWAVEDFSYMFYGAEQFDQPINGLTTSSCANMAWMFSGAIWFNQPLASWDVSLVENMDGMFNDAWTFNQDLTPWCVPKIFAEPPNFATGSALAEGYKPGWGLCIVQTVEAGVPVTLPVELGDYSIIDWGDGTYGVEPTKTFGFSATLRVGLIPGPRIRINVPSGGYTVTVNIVGGPVFIDWGDFTESYYATRNGATTHTYSLTGKLTIQISGRAVN
jgi:hypothetical protein